MKEILKQLLEGAKASGSTKIKLYVQSIQKFKESLEPIFSQNPIIYDNNPKPDSIPITQISYGGFEFFLFEHDNPEMKFVAIPNNKKSA